MKIVAFLVLAVTAVAAQEDPNGQIVDAERVILPCCTKAQTQNALQNLYNWIFSYLNCDPLFVCIFKCLNFYLPPTNCPPNTSLHINFNFWLLGNYKCLPNSLLQCLKGCIRYNSYPPCPIIDIPNSPDVATP
ncbi:hypothetical protein FQR65_LT00868 [Abscondita terminalis]|nr:hypothetical protein FQR65_LT00868 [Abscondita terminalis]